MFAQLRQIALFDSLSDAELAQMAASIAERRLAPGDVLFREGDVGHDCAVVLDGALEITTELNGAEFQLGVFHSGRIVGEMALIDHSPRSATVRALNDCTIAVLIEQHFLTLMRSDPEMAMGMLREGARRLRTANQHTITHLESKNAELARAYNELQAAQADLIRLNRLEEELAIARRIQASFLPATLPQPDGWSVAAFSRGAQAVGGDFFDCIPLSNDHLGLVVADACGKGVTAALFVALTRSLLRAASQAPRAFQDRATLDSDAVLASATWLTNDYITREHSTSNMFVTLFYAVLEPQTGRLSYLNAGHNPPLIVSHDGRSLRELDAQTPPIGLLPNLAFTAAHANIAPGETLIAFSDGITEALNPTRELFDDDRLQALARDHAAATAEDLVQNIVAAVEAFVDGAPQADDMTLLVIKRDG